MLGNTVLRKQMFDHRFDTDHDRYPHCYRRCNDEEHRKEGRQYLGEWSSHFSVERL